MIRLSAGTRGSELALRQTAIVTDLLKASNPEITVERVVIQSHADLHPEEPVNEDWPAGAFVGALEEALLRGEIDIAVHSAKDMPAKPTAGLEVAAYPVREAAHDVLVLRADLAEGFHSLADLFAAQNRPLRIGTGSPRRALQAALLGSVTICPIRGNVPTRIRLIGEALDGVVLAAAGLIRLGLLASTEAEHDNAARLSLDARQFFAFPLDIKQFPTSPGQGAIAVQIRSDNDRVRSLIAPINDEKTSRMVLAEKSYLARMSAGCMTPLGAHARDTEHCMCMHVQAARTSNARMSDRCCLGFDPVELGVTAAEQMLLALGPNVWITHDEWQRGPFQQILHDVPYISLMVVPVVERRALEMAPNALCDVRASDLILFTSAFAVKMVYRPDANARVAAVNSATAAAAREKGYDVVVVGTQGVEALRPQLMEFYPRGMVWHPCSTLSTPVESWAGVEIRRIPVYETAPVALDRACVSRVAYADLAIVTSPSAVPAVAALKIPMASIGPATSAAIRAAGMEPLLEASTPSFAVLAKEVSDYLKRSRHHFA